MQEAYTEIGGFGRFHWIAFLLIITAFGSAQYIFQLLDLLLVRPDEYECSETPSFEYRFNCIPQPYMNYHYFCGTGLYYRLNERLSTMNLNNWYKQLNLTCLSETKINFIG